MTIAELVDHGTEDSTVSGDAMRVRLKAAESAGLYGNVYIDCGTGQVLDARAVAAAYKRGEKEARRWLRRQHPKRSPRISRMHSEYSRRTRGRNRRG